jgi:hypothetical protein
MVLLGHVDETRWPAGDHFSVASASHPWMSEGQPRPAKRLLTSYA